MIIRNSQANSSSGSCVSTDHLVEGLEHPRAGSKGGRIHEGTLTVVTWEETTSLQDDSTVGATAASFISMAETRNGPSRTRTGEPQKRSEPPPKPFFIMDWLEQVDPTALQLAQKMLQTPQRDTGRNGRAPRDIGVTLQPRLLFHGHDHETQVSTTTTPPLMSETMRMTSLAAVGDEQQEVIKTEVKSSPTPTTPGSFFRQRSISIGNGWNAKGLAKAKLGNWEDALMCWENALEIRTQVLGEDHVDVANTYNNMGIAYGRIGQISQALSFLENALDIRTKHYGENHPQVAATLHNMGNALQQAGELDAAVDCFARAKNIQQDLYNDHHHIQVARASLAMGHAYYQGKHYEKAHEAFCESLGIFERLSAEEDEGGTKYASEIRDTRADVQELEALMYETGV